MNRLQGMELFVEVARTLSFGRAAENLAIPKSTLSRQVAELERSVGLRLLSRTTRRVELTEAGQLYFERCQRIVAEARIAHEELQNLVETPSGPLRVNMPADFGTDFLSEAFTEFSRRYPEVTFYLDLASPEHAERVFQTCDVSIEIGDLPDSTHIARLLGVLPAHLYASPDYLARHGEPQHPDDLPRHECIQFRAGTGRVTRWPLNSGERHVEITPGNRFSVNRWCATWPRWAPASRSWRPWATCAKTSNRAVSSASCPIGWPGRSRSTRSRTPACCRPRPASSWNS